MNRQPHRTHLPELPLILERIGVNLDIKHDTPTLKACSLVNHEWHRLFAPFLWWRVIDNFDRVLLRLHKTQFAPSLPNVDPAARLEQEFLALIDTFVAKVDYPTIPMAIHRERRTCIRTPSLVSFLVLGHLCKPIREIDFSFNAPPQFEIYDASVGRMVAPENCRMSDDYWNTEQRIENILTVLENSPSLEVLTFSDSALHPQRTPHQWRQLSLPTTSSWSRTGSAAVTSEEPPRWPKLQHATLKSTKIDHHYLEIFLYNAPRLRTLNLRCLDMINIHGNRIKRNIFPDAVTLAQRSRDFYNSEDSAYPYTGLEELSMIALLGISLEHQLEFALELPDLRSVYFKMDPKLESAHLPFKYGFDSLTSMTLIGNFNHEVLIRAASRLSYLHLTDSSFEDDDLFKTICRHRGTLKTVIIHSRSATLRDGVGPHLILRTCHQLLEFKLYLPRFDCNPELFRDQPWACTDLETLLVVPDCSSTRPDHVPCQAQTALFEQIVLTMPKLRNLSFGGGTGSFGFKPHEGLAQLTLLKKLEVLNLKSKSLETNAPLTVEHAKLFVSEWPELQAIEGLYHYACREFIGYIQEHRPDVDLGRF